MPSPALPEDRFPRRLWALLALALALAAFWQAGVAGHLPEGPHW